MRLFANFVFFFAVFPECLCIFAPYHDETGKIARKTEYIYCLFMRKILLSTMLFAAMSGGVFAQRMTDKLDRGLVALPGDGGTFVSWRIMGEEYYDVEYNLYRDGVKLNETPLKVSNYTDAKGTASSKYQVAAVVRGVEQEKCAAVTRWNSGYLDIPMQSVINRAGANVTGNYTLNDVSLADVDGDGVSEFIVKRNSNTARDYATNKTDFHRLECYNIKGKRLWYIDLGPNMISGPDEQYDIVAYDWDEDGKAEVLLRGADNLIIHKADGTTVNVGNMSFDSRNTLQSDANMAYTHTGNEFLLYLNGETAEPYVQMAYPLPRLEPGETDLNAAWGDGYGHRSTKHYFGAPVLDGRRASIFLGRGAYTRHKMVAYDVDPNTHQLTERWRWNSTGGQWHGQGYHNYGIADVDLDGRDEIVFGSMVIDDNGKGLSTTGFGHGDAQHTGDLDPYRWGLEHFACNEDQPAMNYRNATTSKIYYRLQSTGDDGRALCGNFTNDYPGCVGKSSQSGVVSTVADKVISSLPGFDLNFRIYWDGDLCEEILNSPGTEGTAKIDKMVGTSINRIFTTSGTKMNNWTKNNPGATGDIIGDWREEMVLRTSDNAYLRIYTTKTPTTHRIYTLWHDHQYRNAMVWQSIGYNQPPHLSYFLGEMEGITVAPPPLTNTGRVAVKNGETIGAAHADQHVLVYETADATVSVAAGAQPYMVTFNTPSWVQGSTNNNNIKYEYYTTTVNGAPFTGNMRLVKQGDGILNLPAGEHTYTGETNIWAGTLNFDGKLPNSALWLNRFAKLNSNGGQFKSIKMDYAAELRPGGENSMGNITAANLSLGFGSRVIIDIYNDGLAADQLNVTALSLEKKGWNYGPEYLVPVMEFVPHLGAELDVALGEYLLGEVETVTGNLKDIKIEGISIDKKSYLKHEDGKLYLVIEGVRDAASVIWNGLTSSVWDLANTGNFTMADDLTNTNAVFVSGDKVLFDDTANSLNPKINSDIEADTILVENTKRYYFSGSGKITGNTTLVKRGKGTLAIAGDHDYMGGTRISGGSVEVSSLSNANQAAGNLGGVSNVATKFIIENGAELKTTTAVQMGSPIRFETSEGGVITNTGDFTMNKSFFGTKLTKKGTGWMKLHAGNTSLDTLVVAAGTVQCVACSMPAKNVIFNSGELQENTGSSYAINVPKGKSGTWRTANRSTYSNKITGEGTLTVYCATEKGSGWYATRTPLKLNLSAFKGTFVPQATYADDGRFTMDTSSGMPDGTMNIPSGIVVQNTGKTFTIGKVTGQGHLGGGCTFDNNSTPGKNTWKVGNDDNFSWSGKVTGSGTAFTKIGTGTLTTTSAHDFTGAMRIEEGTVATRTSTKLGTGALTIAPAGTLLGVATLNNASFLINGTVQPGQLLTSFTGKMNFGDKNVTFNESSIYNVAMNGCASSSTTGGTLIEGINKLTMNGTIQLRIKDTYVPVDGDSIIVWKAASFTGTPKFDLPTLPVGYYWDTTRIAEGKLFIAYDANSIETIAPEEKVNVTVITLNGVEVDRFSCPMGAVEETLHETSLEKGIYLLHVQGKLLSTVKKVMKQ